MIKNAIELRRRMQELEKADSQAKVRVSESEYMSGEYWLRCNRRKIERVSRSAVEGSGHFFLYCRAYYLLP